MSVVAVFGAGGFVGATLVERLLARGGWEVRPCIHSTGGAWRLAPLGLPLHTVDVTEPAAVREVLHGCTHVVNAARGERDVMLNGLSHLLAESRAADVERFVHLSSVSAYGVREPGTVLRSDDKPSEILTGYGRMKLEQDQRVEAACQQGLPCVVLAPPYISGAYSGFLLDVLDALRGGRLALINDGDLPCSLIDVENLAHALECALSSERADGRRILVTDDDSRRWCDLIRALTPLSDGAPPPASLDRDRARELTAQPAERASVRASLRTLGSILTGPATRRALADDPLIGRAYALLRAAVPEAAKRSIPGRGQVAPSGLAQPEAGAPYDRHLLEVQQRAVQHSCAAAMETLAYRPVLDFDGSMAAFTRWYRMTHGHGTPSWTALRDL